MSLANTSCRIFRATLRPMRIMPCVARKDMILLNR